MNSLKEYLISHQPYRFIGKSIRNIFFPSKVTILQPEEFFLELISICNAKCVFCNYKSSHRTKSKMSLEDCKDILTSAYNMGYRRLNLTSIGGELFLLKEAIEAIEIAKNIGYTIIETYTNGILLHRFDIKRLLQSGITTLKISFPGFDKESYKLVFGVDKFEEFSKSLNAILKIHKEISSHVNIYLEPRSPLSLSELESTKFYKENISQYISPNIKINKPVVRYDTWGGEIKSTMLPKNMFIEKNPLKRILPNGKIHLCNMMQNFGVLANGDIRICNCRYDSSIETKNDGLYIDNVFKFNSLTEAIKANSDKIDNIKNEFMNGNLCQTCENCTFYTPIKINQKVFK